MTHPSICRDATGTAPCPFVSLCPKERQERAAILCHVPLRGMNCYVYQHLADTHPELLRPATEEQQERAAIEAEGAA